MGDALSVAIDSLGYSCAGNTQPCGSALLVVHHTKNPLLCCDPAGTTRSIMLQNVIILVFTALASSFLWWRSRFKLCRRCRSRIRRWEPVCTVCGAGTEVAHKDPDKPPPAQSWTH